MTQPTYRVTCPIEGLTLLPVVLGPTSAPWFCMACRHSWWVAELSEVARAQFRPSVEDFGYGAPLATLNRLVDAERGEAFLRGTSCRADQLELVPLVGLKRLIQFAQTDQFRNLVAIELARKGG